jgi:hypothetical protein
MKKLIAMFGILALAACGGGDAEEGAATEDTTAITPATETAPVTTTPPMDSMGTTGTMPMDSMGTTGTMPMDSAGATTTTTTTTP